MPPLNRVVRLVHFYIGAFIAPSVILFSLTGMYQLFGLHEARGDYRPLPVAEKLAQVHIHQKYALRPVRGAPPSAAPAGSVASPAAAAPRPPEGAERKPELGPQLLKWVFLLVSAGLLASTLAGVQMALVNQRQRRVVLLLLLAGTALPVIALLL